MDATEEITVRTLPPDTQEMLDAILEDEVRRRGAEMRGSSTIISSCSSSFYPSYYQRVWFVWGALASVCFCAELGDVELH